MTYLVERLAELRRHLDHLREIRPRVDAPADLDEDLSLHNDVLFSLLTVSQLVIDIAGELSARAGHRFEDYTSAVRSLSRVEGFGPEPRGRARAPARLSQRSDPRVREPGLRSRRPSPPAPRADPGVRGRRAAEAGSRGLRPRAHRAPAPSVERISPPGLPPDAVDREERTRPPDEGWEIKEPFGAWKAGDDAGIGRSNVRLGGWE